MPVRPSGFRARIRGAAAQARSIGPWRVAGGWPGCGGGFSEICTGLANNENRIYSCIPYRGGHHAFEHDSVSNRGVRCKKAAIGVRGGRWNTSRSSGVKTREKRTSQSMGSISSMPRRLCLNRTWPKLSCAWASDEPSRSPVQPAKSSRSSTRCVSEDAASFQPG